MVYLPFKFCHKDDIHRRNCIYMYNFKYLDNVFRYRLSCNYLFYLSHKISHISIIRLEDGYIMLNTVKPVLSGHPRDPSKSLLNTDCPLKTGSLRIRLKGAILIFRGIKKP